MALFARRSEQSSGCAALYPPPADSKLPIKFSRDRSGCMALQTASSSVCHNELTTALSAPFGCYPHGAGAEKCTRFVYNSTCPRARAQSTGPPQNRRFGGALTNQDTSAVSSSKQNAGGVGEPRPALTNEGTPKQNEGGAWCLQCARDRALSRTGSDQTVRGGLADIDSAVSMPKWQEMK